MTKGLLPPQNKINNVFVLKIDLEDLGERLEEKGFSNFKRWKNGGRYNINDLTAQEIRSRKDRK